MLFQYHHHRQSPALLPQTFNSPLIRHRRKPSIYHIGKPSMLLTRAIFVFLFRSICCRIKRSKDLVIGSYVIAEKLESLKTIRAAGPVENKKLVSPVQALIGGISAGVISLILYNFITTIEASLNHQTI